jgi:hypothetical protein
MTESKPHPVDRDTVYASDYFCGECGELVKTDGDWWWHEDEKLNPEDDVEWKPLQGEPT